MDDLTWDSWSRVGPLQSACEAAHDPDPDACERCLRPIERGVVGALCRACVADPSPTGSAWRVAIAMRQRAHEDLQRKHGYEVP